MFKSNPPTIGVLDLKRDDLRTHKLCRSEALAAGGNVLDMTYKVPEGTTLEEHVDTYLTKVHAVLLPGNPFDIPPLDYGEAQDPKTVVDSDRSRINFERMLIQKCVKRGIPLYTICGSMQNMVVSFGGSLIQHLPEEWEHQQRGKMFQATHAVTVEKDSTLAALLQKKIPEKDGKLIIETNSIHHQAARAINHPLSPVTQRIRKEQKADDVDATSEITEKRSSLLWIGVSARDSHGVVEAVELQHWQEVNGKMVRLSQHAPALGFQFHPEAYEANPALTKAVFGSLIKAAESYQAKQEVHSKLGKAYADIIQRGPKKSALEQASASHACSTRM